MTAGTEMMRPEEPEQLLQAITGGVDQLARAAVKRLGARQVTHFPGLVSLLDSPDPDHRWWAVRALAVTDLVGRDSLIRRMLADPEEAVVQCALLALREHPAPEAVRELIPLLSCGDALTARLAGEALRVCGEAALPELLEVVRSGWSGGFAEAVRALALLEDPRAVSVLYELLDSESALVTYWAEEGLSRLGVGMVFFKPGS